MRTAASSGTLSPRIPAPRRVEWPGVGVVIATRSRPHLLRRALASVSEQDYPGPLRIVVVFDNTEPDWRLARGGDRPVLVLENWRRPGLAGARNTGVLAAGDCELVALCDDDDTWAPNKLSTQVSALRARPGALFATCAVEVEYDGRRTAELAGRRELHPRHLTRTDARSLRPSGFLARQDALAADAARGGIGLLAEDGPACGEEWDLLLRAARRAPIVHVDTPLVRELWRNVVIDDAECAVHARALHWMIARHPEIRRRPAAARLYAEIACWEAARGNRAAALGWAVVALRNRWFSGRAGLAVAAAAGLLRRKRLTAYLRQYRLS
jgi:glycosyltransferase involved in cell wall biosynthesis